MATILAVDDSYTMRQMLAVTLQNDGHDVIQAEDGKVALKMARAQAFDLVITDVYMPNMDGITLVSELRKLPGFEGTPLLVLTTESGTDKKQAGKRAGANGWIVKPVNEAQLIDVIRRTLG
ncbi:MAG: response regulator [Gammaproteobacteria bacterium]|nr:response regulator [Gammaproteobacteria bacterium]MDH3858936.1 response regulator [Gammaproteobacteria bacterium]